MERLSENEAFGEASAISYRDRTAWQHVAETTVTLHRPAKHRVEGRQRAVPGRPLPLRLVVSRVCDERGQALATWMLLSNVPAERAEAETLALWYYWRWRIESFFKLLKSDGHQLEHWQQQSAAAIFRRLLVAAMACVCVWDLQRRNDEPAEELKGLLIRLSGRQTRHDRPVTAPALLAGLFVLLPMLELLQQHDGDLSALQELADHIPAPLRPG